ncbi:ABC transporter ATP-binding protein [Oceanihabitans sediminis]|uniref:ABC transporter ATP-binding protein n=1 Tax=Oceanihabitans sediminis TaxID=1812012 RepID=A0A368P5H1_9FLAO|nr:ABC transporter ATP-binding protein [Oceanihabitans sediminis]MDX1278955.1 ABC transporter ATP-binding protein [Oceanihabitans sediminis]MDX1774572.1 ABC transporter ATP-binding protein [Oceanihabitans sediminis]RBP29031.1 subfamily B ATP-binding cassette protein MsbA [Oceanihabitans sediminis]RCU57039.1 ABC transporter ATP-binding protein [Oceanihabitans sediminis]
MEYLKKISKFLIPYKKYGYLNIFFNVLYALFSTLAMVSLMPMINVLFGETEKLYEKPVYQGIRGIKTYGQDYLNYFVTITNENEGPQITLLYMIILIISLFLLKNVFNYLALFFITFLRNGVLKDLRNSIYNKVLTLPISYYSEKKKGDIIARISGDVNEVKNSLLAVLELIIKEPLTIVFAIVTMFTISMKLTVFVFIFIPVAGFIISRIGKSLKKKSGRVQQEQGVFLSTLEETLSGLKVIKGFNAEDQFNKRFQESTNRFYNYSNTLLNRQNLASPTSEFLGIATIAALLWYGGSMVLIDKSLSGGAFITYMALAYQILTPAKAISKASYQVKAGNAAADRVLEIIETPSPLEDKLDAKVKEGFHSEIAINNISFKYQDDLVLKNFSVNVPKGKTVALVGQSGSGKSTIANLVTRFYDVNEGSITIDGEDIRDLTKKSLRSLIGLVTQDSILFNETVKNNLLIGNPNATDEEVIDALKIANAWEFVKDLPKGIETNIGDSGGKLSGGQKQRLSIARAVLKNPPIMILDEATSALDTESERLVQVALENMMKNRTSIVIAHRLSTIQNADKILVMQKGEIAEQGTHKELLAKQGIYQKLVEMQSFE